MEVADQWEKSCSGVKLQCCFCGRGRPRAFGQIGARSSWPQCLLRPGAFPRRGRLERGNLGRGALKVGRVWQGLFFGLDCSGAVESGDVAVLSAVLVLRAWTPARLCAHLARAHLGRSDRR